MATIFPISASVGQVYSGYEFDGTSWNIIGINLTADYALDSELTTHEADTTDVHGITDTSVIATMSDVSSASAQSVSSASALAYASASSYTDTSISNLIDSAPATLNTLNEIAAAINDDANFSASVVNHVTASTNVHGIADMGTLVSGSGITNIVALTQAEYDALTPDATTLYVVTD